MDYNLIKGFCRRYALSPLTFHDENCFTAEMIGCVVDVGPCREPAKRSGRQRVAAILYLPRGPKTTEDLHTVKVKSASNFGLWNIGELSLCLQTWYNLNNHLPYVRLEVSIMVEDPYVLGSRYDFCSTYWDWDEPEAIAARDVILGRQPPEMFLDWLQERDFSIDSPVWQQAMHSLSVT